MWRSSDLVRFSGTKLQQSDASVCPVMSDIAVVTMSTSNLITVDNDATPALLMKPTILVASVEISTCQ